MKRIFPYVASILFFAFLTAVFLLVISLTFSALGRIFPGNLLNQALGLAMFDIAAAVWLGVLIYTASGFWQRAIALLMFAVSFIGTIGMVAAEVVLVNSAALGTPGWLTQAVAYSFITVGALHLGAIYAYHISDPETNLKIELQAEKDEVIQQALKDARAAMNERRPELARNIAAGYVQSVYRELGQTPTGLVIDAQSIPALENDQAQDGAGFLSGLASQLNQVRQDLRWPPSWLPFGKKAAHPAPIYTPAPNEDDEPAV